MLALSQQGSRTPESAVVIRPSAKLLKPFYWAAAILTGLIFAYSNNAGNTTFYPLLVIPGAIVLWTLARHVRLRSTKLGFGGGKIRYETGLFSRSVRTMELSKVQDVRVDQTFINRMLNLGTLAIETAGESSRLTMHGVENPHNVADYILETIRK